MSNQPCNARTRVLCHVGEWFADINFVCSVPHSGAGVMVCTRISYGQHRQLHFINCNLNAQRYRDEILWPIVVPFILRHHLMFQRDIARICKQFPEAENIPVILWLAYSPDMSPIEHVRDALDRRVRQHVPVPVNIHQLLIAIEDEWDNIPQATINSTADQLYVKDMCHTA